MKYISLLLSLLFFFTACSDQSKIERAFLMDQNIKHNNEIIDNSIKGLINKIVNTSKEKPYLKPIADLARSLPELIEGLLETIDESRAAISNPKGVYLYQGELHHRSSPSRKARFQKTGLENFVDTDNKSLEGRPLDADNQLLVYDYFIKGGQAKVLADMLEELHADLSDLLYVFQQEIEILKIDGVHIYPHEIDALQKQLDLLKPTLTNAEGKKLDWQEVLFANSSIAEVYPILRKLQAEAKQALLNFVQFLDKVSTTEDLVYDKYEVFSSAKKPVVVLGEAYEADIALGAFSSQAEFSVKVNGHELKVEGGKAKYKVKAKSPGSQHYTANIIVKNPLTGRLKRVSKEFRYGVAPSNLQLNNLQNNVLYLGIPNPIKVVSNSISSNDLAVYAEGAGDLKIQKSGRYRYLLSPQSTTNMGKFSKLLVKDKNTGKVIQKQSFRVKRLPDPSLALNIGDADGRISVAKLQKATGLLATTPQIPIDFRTEILSFEVYYLPKAGQAEQFGHQGASFNSKLLGILSKLQAGDQLILMNVRVKQPSDLAARRVTGLSFILE